MDILFVCKNGYFVNFHNFINFDYSMLFNIFFFVRDSLINLCLLVLVLAFVLLNVLLNIFTNMTSFIFCIQKGVNFLFRINNLNLP